MIMRKRMRNRELALKWSSFCFPDGFSITNHEQTLRIAPDGKVYSYCLLIGEILGGKKVVYDYTAPGGCFHSNTTSRHVGLIKTYSDEILPPT